MELEKIKIGLSGAAVGAFVLFGIGFGMSGWVLGGTAEERTRMAVVDNLTPICEAQFQQDPAKAGKLAAMKKLPYADRGKFVADQGWATMPGASTPDMVVAEKCSDRISR